MRFYSPVRTVDPTADPVSLTEAKTHCRALQDVHDEDALILSYIKAAAAMYETHTERSGLTQTWRWTLDDFPRCQYALDGITLPKAAPLQSVTSVKYYDSDGTQQTLSSSVYRVDTDSQPGRVVLKPDQSWPDVQSERGQAVEIVYVAGHTNASLVPYEAKVGMYLLIDHLYENRSSVMVGVGIGAVEVPVGAWAFWAGLRVWSV